MAGKNIRIFLIEGTPNQRLYCELSNWNGRVYRIPRNEIKISEDRSDLQYTSAYVLLGKNDDGAILAYIGECDNARDRLLQHLKQKDFWNEVIVFIRTDNSLNKAHVKYIEKRLYDIANEISSNFNVTIIEKPENFVFEHRDFIGWSYRTEGGNILNVGDTLENVENDFVLYAQWQNKTYTITFNDRYNSGVAPEDMTFVYGRNVTLPDMAGSECVDENGVYVISTN